MDKETVLDKSDACIPTAKTVAEFSVQKQIVSSNKNEMLRYLLFKFNCDDEMASRKLLPPAAKVLGN
jgi:hypothetical protein